MAFKKDSNSLDSEQEKSQNEDVSLLELKKLENIAEIESQKVNILWSQNYRRNQYAEKEKKDNQNIFCRDNFERRLFYTAVTRAKKSLNIYYLN